MSDTDVIVSSDAADIQLLAEVGPELFSMRFEMPSRTSTLNTEALERAVLTRLIPIKRISAFLPLHEMSKDQDWQPLAVKQLKDALLPTLDPLTGFVANATRPIYLPFRGTTDTNHRGDWEELCGPATRNFFSIDQANGTQTNWALCIGKGSFHRAEIRSLHDARSPVEMSLLMQKAGTQMLMEGLHFASATMARRFSRRLEQMQPVQLHQLPTTHYPPERFGSMWFISKLSNMLGL